MNMIPKNQILDTLIRRTKHNLEFIEVHSTEEGPYEVTQLINSMFGLIILPFEKYIPHNRITLIHDMRFEEVKCCYKTCVRSDRVRSLDSFIMMMRNAFAHANVEFTGKKDIERVVLWNYKYVDGRRTDEIDWKVEIPLSALRRLSILIADHIEENLSN